MISKGLIRNGKLEVLPFASSTHIKNERVKNPVRIIPNNDRWCGLDIPNQWYQVAFLNGYVYLNKYLFQRSFNHTPTSWYVEGYTIYNEWKTISEGKYSDFGDSFVHYYDITERDPLTTIRFKTNATNFPESNYFFCISLLEFYGKIMIYKTPKTCKKYRIVPFSFIFLLL